VARRAAKKERGSGSKEGLTGKVGSSFSSSNISSHKKSHADSNERRNSSTKYAMSFKSRGGSRI